MSSASSSSPPPSDTSSLSPSDSLSSSNTGSSSSGSSGSSSASSSSSGSSTSSPSQSTIIETQTNICSHLTCLRGTNAQGSAFTSTVVSYQTSISNSTDVSTSTSHTGAIVGGVVGGIAGLSILVLLLFFLCRRRRRDDFDGNFDPDRVVGVSGRDGATLPPIDLAGADDVTPYQYTPQGASSPEMSQAHVPAFLAGGLAGAGAMRPGSGSTPPATSAPSQYSQSQSQSHYPPSSSDHYADYAAYSGYAQQPQPQPYDPRYSLGAAAPANDFRHPSPGPSLAMTNSTGPTQSGSAPGVIPSAKEREASRGGGGLQVANQDVLQHQDGGRLSATPEEEGPSEIPPRYDSIPRED
ncbi:hypothetical protein B0H21DRAFT_756164 [Amylocystis lapponica]|nr:hypothetical protein B0H21DRAFT_756164 [Amylocystis lapponica]